MDRAETWPQSHEPRPYPPLDAPRREESWEVLPTVHSYPGTVAHRVVSSRVGLSVHTGPRSWCHLSLRRCRERGRV